VIRGVNKVKIVKVKKMRRKGRGGIKQ